MKWIVGGAIVMLLVLLVLLREDGRLRANRVRQPAYASPAAPHATPPETTNEIGDKRDKKAGTDPLPLVARGRVVDREGRGLAGLRLLVVSESLHPRVWEADDPRIPAGSQPVAPFTFTGSDGGFAFEGLAPGLYRLEIDGDAWMPDDVYSLQPDSTDIRVVALRARSITVYAKSITVRASDLLARKAIRRFTVRYRWSKNSPEQTGEGRSGFYRKRLRRPPKAINPSAWGDVVVVEVEAAGYHPAKAYVHLGSNGRAGEAWLAPLRAPNLTLRVRYDDGTPCLGPAEVRIGTQGKETAELPVEEIGDGLYEVGLPPGKWTLWFNLEQAWMFREPTHAEVEVAEGRRGELELVVERGGEVTIRRRDWDGKPWSIQIRHANSMTFVCASQGQWFARLLPPNDYTFSVTKGLIAMNSATSWTRKVTVTPGSVHELVFPE